MAFKYDPFGRRIEKKYTTPAKTITWTYVYDGDEIALETETDGTTTTKTFYTHGRNIDEHLALERSGSFYYYHQDGLGSVTAITDASRNVVQRYSYDSFGKLTAQNSFKNSYTFTGREYDPQTGLYFYRARYYDPVEGRFLQKDPIGFAGGINLYAYVDSVGKPLVPHTPQTNLYQYTENNPINGTDPLGLFTVSEVPSMIKAGANKLFQKLPEQIFDKVLGRLLGGPTSVLDFFAFPDTFAYPMQEDPRYKDLFPNIYGYPGNSPDRYGLQYDAQSGLYLKKHGAELHNCRGN